jgi:O-antigen chain-terminating methyltransferase
MSQFESKPAPEHRNVPEVAGGDVRTHAPIDVDAMMEQVRAEVKSHEPPPVSEESPQEASLSPTEIMRRVRAEVARRAAAQQTATLVAPVADVTLSAPVAAEILPRWHPAAGRLPDQPQYVLADFLRFDDEDFVDTAYHKLLHRPADPVGRQDYLDALRSGTVSKVEILGFLRFSEEGRRHAVHVDGLLLPYKLHRWRHMRVFGWFIGMGMAVVRLPRLAWRLQGMEASSAREAQAIGRLLGQVESGVETQLAEVVTTVRALQGELGQAIGVRVEGLRRLDLRIDEVRTAAESSGADAMRKLAALDAELCALTESLRTSNAERVQERDSVASRMVTHEAALANLTDHARGDQRRVYAMLERLTVFLDAASRRESQANDVDGSVTPAPALEAQYASFESTFRGARDEIKARAAHYLGSLATAGIQPGDPDPVLDLGSGRGELLEVLVEHGYRARGVDLNRGMLQESMDRGHDVVEADALGYLRIQPSDSVAAITSLHMVEHIPNAILNQLLDEALRVLRPGGMLILETPNPENVLVGSCMFYMDPTHLHPIPPALLQWTVQARGFEQAVIERLTEHRGTPELQPVSDQVPGAAQINQMVAWFTAPPDYAVIARKAH